MFPKDPMQFKEIPPQRDTDPMFVENEGQSEVETQGRDDLQSKSNGGKEQATKRQYLEAEYDTDSKVPEKLDISWYINDANVTAEIKYARFKTEHHQLDLSFHQRNTKIKGDHLDLSKDTASTAGSHTLTLYCTLPVKMGCIVQYMCCFTQKPRENN